MSSIAARLSELGLSLPEAPRPVASYVPAARAGSLIFVSGQIPLSGGELVCTGPVPSATSLTSAQAAARQCALNALAVVSDHLDGDLDRVERIVRLGIYVASEPGFTEQARVANGASDLLVDVFGDAGRHARAAVGSIALPLNAPVMVEMVVQVR